MNEILFLGTGADDWCLEDRNGFFRRNSSVLINNDLIVDCGKHIFDFLQHNNENLYDNVTDVIITHSHSDHYSKESILKIAKKQKIRLGCSKKIMNIIGECENIEYVIFEPYKEYEMGNYKIVPVLANHHVVVTDDDYAFHYIITTKDSKNIFYGLDGAWFLRPTWEEMHKYNFDVMVFDCTVGDSDDWRIFEHNTIPMLRMMLKEIKNQKMLNENGLLVASHLARTLHTTHEETSKILKEIDVVTAYDGMKINF